jgi:hypothetical protein
MLFGTALAIVQDPLPRYYRRCTIKSAECIEVSSTYA